MPEHPPSLIHFRTPYRELGPAVCGADNGWRCSEPGKVTCFACRKSEEFKAAQRGVETPTPLRDVIKDDPELEALAGQAITAAAKNHRGMFVIEEVIHHGTYRSQRYVEVYAINMVTVDCIIQSSAYCYGSWLDPENPAHKEPRNTKLRELVDDLLHGRTNRSVGWSTFRTITEH